MKHAFAFALIALPGVASAAMTEMDDAALAALPIGTAEG